MKKQSLSVILVVVAGLIYGPSCNKEKQPDQKDLYNLDIILTGSGIVKGTITFRQDPDTTRIITLNTKIEQLQPNHEYLLQRAVDTQIDGNCTGTAWLTLGKGLTPRSIFTGPYGQGSEELWRDVTSASRGSVFDIHFQVVDAANMTVVLTSGCHQYTVR